MTDDRTQEEFHNMVKDTAAAVFLKQGNHMPTGVVDLPGKGMALAPLSFDNVQEKHVMMELFMKAVEKAGSKRFSFVSEVWIAVVKKEDIPIDITDIVPPSEREDRKEALLVVTYEDGARPISGFFPILRDGDNEPTLGPYEPGKGDMMGLNAFAKVGYESQTKH